MKYVESKAVSRLGSGIRNGQHESSEVVEVFEFWKIFRFAPKPQYVLLRKVFERVKVLVRRGLSLGLVLFLALSTLSMMNRGVDSIGSFLGLKKQERVAAPAFDSPRVLMVPRASQGYASAYSYRPPTGGGRGTSNTRDTIRESSYFLNALRDFSNSLGRFAKG